jgi:hypothetical protein
MPRLRRYLLLPVLAAGLTVSACGGDSGSSIIKGSPPSNTPSATTAPAKVSITKQTIKEETDRYAINLSYPQTGIAAADTQIKKMVDAEVSDIKKWSNDAKGAPPSAAGKYTLDGGFDTSLAGPDIVSIRQSVATYTGGAHGAHHVIGLNYDKNGKALTLDDALAMTKLTLSQLSTQVTQELKAKLGRDFLFPEGAAPDRKNFETFLISPDKVTFVFQEYQVAPYVAGMQQVSVPRS